MLALAHDYLRAGLLDRAEGLFLEVCEVPRLRASALDSLRGVYERQLEWERMATQLGALLERAEKHRCGECGFAGRSFYWHCPACHSWDSFEAYALVKLG